MCPQCACAVRKQGGWHRVRARRVLAPLHGQPSRTRELATLREGSDASPATPVAWCGPAAACR